MKLTIKIESCSCIFILLWYFVLEIRGSPIFLQSFSLDMRYGKVILGFNNIVNASTLQVAGIQFQSYRNHHTGNERVRLTGTYNSMSSQGNSTTPYFFLNSDDYSNIKSHVHLASSINYTYISFAETILQSPNGSYVTAINQTNAFQATNYVPDTTPPYVENFDLDMNSGIMIIDFSEPILRSSFNIEGLAIQSLENAFPSSPLKYNSGIFIKRFMEPQWPHSSNLFGHTGPYIQFINREVYIISLLNYHRRIVFQLGPSNLNAIKESGSLCTTSKNCFISGWKSFINDTSGNPLSLAGFEIINGLKVNNFTADRTHPLLQSWAFDMNEGIVHLTFDEVVYVRLFNFSKILLSNTNVVTSNSSLYRIDNPTLLTTPDSITFSIQLQLKQFNTIKDNTHILKSKNNSYLIIEYRATSDTSAKQNLYLGLDASFTNARKITNLTYDTTRPYLTSATLNMTSQQLVLQFSESIRYSSFKYKALNLQSISEITIKTESFVLTPLIATIINIRNSLTLTIQFTAYGFSLFKLTKLVGRSKVNTYLSFLESLIEDVGGWPDGNQVIPISYGTALNIPHYIPDYQPPILTSWSIDISTNKMILYFTEPLNITSITMSAITFQNELIYSPTQVFMTLTKSTVITHSHLNILYIQLSYTDANTIKSSYSLCERQDQCYLTMHDNFAYDTFTMDNNNKIVQNYVVPITTPMISTAFRVDVEVPYLLGYTIDMMSGVLVFTFSEPVVGSLFNVTGITLFSSSSGSNISFTPSLYSYTLSIRSETITIGLSTYDYHLLQQASPTLAMAAITTNMMLRNATVTDTAGNPLRGFGYQISSGDYQDLHQPTSYGIDYNNPYIVAFSVNRTSLNLTIFFNIAVKVGTIVPSKFYFTLNGGRNTYSLTNSIVKSVRKTHAVVFDISRIYDDMLVYGFATTPESSYIYISVAKAVKSASTSAAPNDKMSPKFPVKEGQYVVSFHLDISQKRIILMLAVPIDRCTLSAKLLTLKNIVYSSSFTLTGYRDLSLDGDGYILIIDLKDDDVAAIQSAVYLTIDRKSLYLSMPAISLLDGEGYAMSTALNVPCAVIVFDVVAPSVNSFLLDLSTGIMTLILTEPVLLSSVKLPYIGIANQAVNATSIIYLNNSVILNTGLASSTLLIQLTSGDFPTDCDRMYLSRNVGISTQSTYLVMSAVALTDTSHPANYVTEIPITDALQVTTLKLDQTTPQVTSFDVDMSARTLTVYFDKAVNATSTQASYYTLWARSGQNTAPNVNLITSAPIVTGLGAGRSVTILFSNTDFDSIMSYAPSLCTSSTNTFLAFRRGATRDITTLANRVAEQLSLYAIGVTNFITDTTSPELLSYDISLKDSTAKFHFDKYVSCENTIINYIKFQYSYFLGISQYYYSLTSSSSSTSCDTSSYSKSITINIGTSDLNTIKATSRLLKEKKYTYLRLTKGAFQDVFGNQINAIVDGEAVLVTNYTGDTIPPVLQGFVVNKGGLVKLYFNEPIALSSFHIPGISFQNGGPNITIIHILKTATIFETDALFMQITLVLNKDFGEINSISTIFTDQSKSYITAASSTCTDTSGNYLANITSKNALVQGPVISYWSINMNTGRLDVYFSENVNPSFSPLGMGIQNAKKNSTLRYKISSTTSHMQANGTSKTHFYSILSATDLSAIKYYGIATSASKAWLTSPLGITRALAPSTVIPYLSIAPLKSNNALVITQYVSDTSAPLLESVTLDLSAGVIRLFFNEPVRASSLVVSGITLLSGQVGSSATLTTSATTILLTSYSVISFNLSSTDLNAIKVATATYPLDSAILSSSSIIDYAGNYNTGNDADSLVPITSIIMDTVAPVLNKFQLFLNTMIIKLTFSEIINSHLIESKNIRLLSHSNESTAEILQLTNYSLIENAVGNVVSIDLGLYRHDALALQRLSSLGRNTSNTYIRVMGVEDLFGNKLADTSPFQSTSVQADTTAPLLESFDFSPLVSGSTNIMISLYFSKIMSIASFHCEDFAFRASADSYATTEYVVLASTDCTVLTSRNDRVINITLASSLSSTVTIGSTEDSTYMYIPRRGNTTDIFGNRLAAITSSNALRVGPAVTKYVLNMDLGCVTLMFSKSIDRIGSYNISGIGFYSLVSSSSIFLTSTNTSFEKFLYTSPNIDDIAVLYFSSSDFIRLKEIDVQDQKVVLLVNPNTLYDRNGVSLVPLTASSLKLNGYLFPDVTPPVLQSLALDMSLELIRLVFNEPVLVASVDESNFRIQSLPHSYAISRKLLGGGSSTLVKETLTVYMTLKDSSAIKLNPLLAKSENNSYISFSLDTVTDLAGNGLTIDSSSDARHVDVYINDTRRPTLNSFSLDMNTGTLTLNFSEPVIVSAMNLSTITLQSRYLSSTGTYYQLTGGAVTSSSGFSIVIKLSAIDLAGIKNQKKLCRSRQLSYLRVTSSTTIDTSNNKLVGIVDGNAMLCTTFVADTESPYVMGSTLDMNGGSLTLYLSEAVIISSLSLTALSIQSTSALVDGVSYTLSATSTVTTKSTYSSTILITLSTSDLNTLKSRYPLASSLNTSWITISTAFAKDTFSNAIAGIYSYAATQVTTYITNKVIPVLTKYELNMNDGYIQLTFSETMSLINLDLSNIVIEQATVKRFGTSLNLSHCSAEVGSDASGNVVTINLDSYTLTYLKWNEIGLNLTTSYLSWGLTFISDNSNNYLLPRWDASIYGYTPLPPDVFIADDTPPVIQKWLLDRSLGKLYLFFDEPVIVVDASNILLFIGKPSQLTNGTHVLISTTTTSTISYLNNGLEAMVNLREMCGGIGNITGNFDISICSSSSFLGKVALTDQSLYLLHLAGAVEDRAETPNKVYSMTVEEAMREGKPNCDVCGAGEYVSQNCTKHSDRVCSPCSPCSVGEYVGQACSNYHNTGCRACTPCTYGTTTDVACGADHDTVCKLCSVCDSLQYEATPCSPYQDIICNSCKVCKFPSSIAAAGCSVGSYNWWFRENCCFDEDGNQQTCSTVDYMNMYISARDGRHHWVFDPTIPQVDGYKIGTKF